MENKKERQHSRPLAPDLQTYRPTLTMTMSIVHRATGIVLYVGFVGMAAWLTALAAGPRAYETMQRILDSWVGLPVLFVFTWAILHHAFGGIRHLIWDLSIAHTYPWREYLTRATLAASLACAVLFWIALLWTGGHPS